MNAIWGCYAALTKDLSGDYVIRVCRDEVLNCPHWIDFTIQLKKPTCFKGSPSCIGLIITNRKAYFKNACILGTGISDFHKSTTVSLTSQMLKAPPKRKLDRNYKAFDENIFKNDLKTKSDSMKILD